VRPAGDPLASKAAQHTPPGRSEGPAEEDWPSDEDFTSSNNAMIGGEKGVYSLTR
jgi:hypothetical protein